MNIKERAALLKHLLLQLIENQVLPQGGYLAGGTAVYFYLRHRFSVDLEFSRRGLLMRKLNYSGSGSSLKTRTSSSLRRTR